MVLREVRVLCAVGLPDSLWLPHPHPGQLPDQEIQLPQPLPIPGVSLGPVLFQCVVGICVRVCVCVCVCVYV